MQSQGTELRRRFFRLYAANLSRFVPAFGGQIFGCPICMRFFAEPAVEEPDKNSEVKLSLGHLWPSSSGGNLYTLECKKCNNRLGTIADKHIKERAKQWKALSSKRAMEGLPGVFRIGEHEGKARFTMSKEGMSIVAQPHHSKPQVWDKIKGSMLTGNFKWSVTLPDVPTNRLNVGLLHAAYLTAFYRFGYEYIWRADTQWIRDILTAETVPDVVEVPCFYPHRDKINITAEDGKGHIWFGKTDQGEYCIGVVFPNDHSPDHPLRVVLLPGFGVEAMDDYRKLLVKEGGRTMDMKRVDDKPPHIRLASEHDHDYARGTDLWLRYTGRESITSYKININVAEREIGLTDEQIADVAVQVKAKHPDATHFAVPPHEGIMYGTYLNDETAFEELGGKPADDRKPALVFRLDGDMPKFIQGDRIEP